MSWGAAEGSGKAEKKSEERGGGVEDEEDGEREGGSRVEN